MDELIDVLDANGNKTGETVLKSEAHRQGIFHQTIHVWFYNSSGEILFQQRGSDKKTFPLLWDVSVAGHIGAGEIIEEAAIREISEEIGLQVTKEALHKIGIFKTEHRHAEDIFDREFHHTFLCELKVPLQELTKQEEEVEALDLIAIETFREALEVSDSRFVPNSKEHYLHIVSEIEKRLQT